MATVITSDMLEVGDVFFDPRHVPVNAKAKWNRWGGLRRVREIRDMHVNGGHYRVINYDVLDTELLGQIDLRVDVAVARVAPVTSHEASRAAEELVDGDLVTIWCAEGRLWI